MMKKAGYEDYGDYDDDDDLVIIDSSPVRTQPLSTLPQVAIPASLTTGALAVQASKAPTKKPSSAAPASLAGLLSDDDSDDGSDGASDDDSLPKLASAPVVPIVAETGPSRVQNHSTVQNHLTMQTMQNRTGGVQTNESRQKLGFYDDDAKADDDDDDNYNNANDDDDGYEEPEIDLSAFTTVGRNERAHKRLSALSPTSTPARTPVPPVPVSLPTPVKPQVSTPAKSSRGRPPKSTTTTTTMRAPRGTRATASNKQATASTKQATASTKQSAAAALTNSKAGRGSTSSSSVVERRNEAEDLDYQISRMYSKQPPKSTTGSGSNLLAMVPKSTSQASMLRQELAGVDLKSVTGIFMPDGRYMPSAAELWHLQKQEEEEAAWLVQDGRLRGTALFHSQQLLKAQRESTRNGDIPDDGYADYDGGEVDSLDVSPIADEPENDPKQANLITKPLSDFIPASKSANYLLKMDAFAPASALKNMNVQQLQPEITVLPILTGGSTPQKTLGISRRMPAAAGSSPSSTPRKPTLTPTKSTSVRSTPTTMTRTQKTIPATRAEFKSAETNDKCVCCFPLLAKSQGEDTLSSQSGGTVITFDALKDRSDGAGERCLAAYLVPLGTTAGRIDSTKTRGEGSSKSSAIVSDMESGVARSLVSALSRASESSTTTATDESKTTAASTSFFGLGARVVVLDEEGTSVTTKPARVVVKPDDQKDTVLQHLRKSVQALREARDKAVKKNKSLPAIDPQETRKLEALTYKWRSAAQAMLRDLLPVVQQQVSAGGGVLQSRGGYFDEETPKRRPSSEDDYDEDKAEDEEQDETDNEITMSHLLRNFNIPPEMVFWNEKKDDFDDPPAPNTK